VRLQSQNITQAQAQDAGAANAHEFAPAKAIAGAARLTRY
jgi:hypothetical protein